MLDLYLIRHGQSLLNTNRAFINGRSSDTPLTDLGRTQAYRVGEALREVPFDMAVSSTAVRATETANRVMSDNVYFQDLRKDIVKTFELEELDQGDWQGLDRVTTYNEATMKELHRLGIDFKPPNGESQREVASRMNDWVHENIMSRIQDRDTKVAIFGHGVLFKTWLQKIMNFDVEWIFPTIISNCGVTRLQYKDGRWGLICFNWASPNESTNPLTI